MPSLCLRTHPQKSINNNISFCKTKISFKSSTQLANFFRVKDKIALCLHSGNVYKFAYRHFEVRVGEHSGIPPLTDKRSKSVQLIAVKDHMLMCDHIVSFDNLKVLSSSNSEFHLKIKESVLTSRD